MFLRVSAYGCVCLSAANVCALCVTLYLFFIDAVRVRMHARPRVPEQRACV